jgi:hypothetical protein
MTAKIQVRRDTSANWGAGTPPTLASGELGLDTTLNQLKAGDNTSPWNTLPWLGGTLPYFSSPTSTDLNDSSNRVAGRYRFTSVTNGPANELVIVTNDGGINMVVMVFGTTVVQQLWTDGDGGTQVPKSYSRVYDGDVSAWRPWAAQSLWGISTTEGVAATVRSLTVKDTATVDGNLTLNGSLIAGDGSLDVIQARKGMVGNPSITFQTDTDTGAYSPAADEYAIATNGVRRIHQTDTTTTIDENLVAAKNFRVNGQLNGAMNCGAQLLTNLGAATSALGAMRLGDINAQKLVSFAYMSGTGPATGSDGTTWTKSTNGGNQRMTADSGNWVGMLARFELGGGTLQAVAVSSGAGSSFLQVAGNAGDGVMLFAVRVP